MKRAPCLSIAAYSFDLAFASASSQHKASSSGNAAPLKRKRSRAGADTQKQLRTSVCVGVCFPEKDAPHSFSRRSRRRCGGFDNGTIPASVSQGASGLFLQLELPMVRRSLAIPKGHSFLGFFGLRCQVRADCDVTREQESSQSFLSRRRMPIDA